MIEYLFQAISGLAKRAGVFAPLVWIFYIVVIGVAFWAWTKLRGGYGGRDKYGTRDDDYYL